MYNAILTVEGDEEPTLRIPWRTIAILALILFAGLYGCLCLRHAVSQYRADQHEAMIALAGPIAEAMEIGFVHDPVDNQPLLSELCNSVFAAEQDLAAVRVWDTRRQLVAEVTKAEPSTVRLGKGLLPDLHARQAMAPLLPRLTQHRWTDPIAQILLLQNEQHLLAERMQQAAGGPAIKELCQSFYVPQDTLLQLVETMEHDGAALSNARRDMNIVLTALTSDEPDALEQALSAIENVQADLTYALSAYRSTMHPLPSVPTALAKHAPSSEFWWGRLWPGVHGERLLAPLFVPTTDEQLVAPAGFVEILVYTRPVEALGMAGWRLLPIGGALLLAFGLACLRRRAPRMQPRVQPPATIG